MTIIFFSEITSKSSVKDSQIPAKNFKKDLHRRFLKESRESIDDDSAAEVVLDVGNSNASTSNMGGNCLILFSKIQDLFAESENLKMFTPKNS